MTQQPFCCVTAETSNAAKDYEFTIGWRPKAVAFFRSDGSGKILAFAVDGVTAAGKMLAFDLSATGSDAHDVGEVAKGVTFTARGFRIGQHAAFKVEGKKLVFLCFRELFPLPAMDLSEPTADPSVIGVREA